MLRLVFKFRTHMLMHLHVYRVKVNIEFRFLCIPKDAYAKIQTFAPFDKFLLYIYMQY